MGNLPMRIISKTFNTAPKEIRPLTNYLENNKTFKKASSGIHHTKIGIVDKFMNSLHNSAFPENEKMEKLYKLEDKNNNKNK